MVVETAVEFVELTPETMVDWYVATGEPFGKAGGYAIQGAGGALVRRLDGSVTNVIGLPLAETLDLISQPPNPEICGEMRTERRISRRISEVVGDRWGWHSRGAVANGGVTRLALALAGCEC